MLNTKMKSRYFGAVDIENPLPEYPRPQLQREKWQSLNGYYDYCIRDIESIYPDEFTGKIIVPYPIESKLSGVGQELLPTKKLWYRRTFSLPEINADERVILHFGAVDYEAEVYINHTLVGKHIGGYLPFSFDITPQVKQGENELIVGVIDPTDTFDQERGKQTLSSGGIWYTASSGIWQTVWYEIVNEAALIDLLVKTDIDTKSVKIKPIISDMTDLKINIMIRVQDRIIIDQYIRANIWNEITIPEPILWSPETPFLYSIRLVVSRDDLIVDEVESYFGMRKIEVKQDTSGHFRIYLNEQPIFQSGVLDQGYYPDGLLCPPTDQAMIDDITTMKNMGFNMLRKHVKIESARWYYHCDRIGMLVWQDMPNGGSGRPNNLLAVVLPNIGIHIKDNRYRWFQRESENGKSRFETNLKQMIQFLGFFPSIVVWVPFNEGWGQFDARRIAKLVKEIDPTRLVDHASGWHDQKGGDLASIHRYILKIKKPRKNSRVFVVSEFGGYSMVDHEHAYSPEASFGYRQYKDSGTLEQAIKKLYEEQILPLVPKGLSACVYTQLSDVELEVNGLMTYDREVIKINPLTMKSINSRLLAAFESNDEQQ